MKYILLVTIMSILMLSGCGSSSKVDQLVVEDTHENVESSYKIGKVFLNEEGCETYILTEGANQEKLYPVGLDDTFLVHDAILQFEYALSRAPLPAGCEDCKAVVLRSISRVKR